MAAFIVACGGITLGTQCRLRGSPVRSAATAEASSGIATMSGLALYRSSVV